VDKILMLARGNIRKTKGQTAILAILFFVSSVMLIVGLSVSLNFGNFFDSLADELKTSDAYFIIPESAYNDEVEQYLTDETDFFQTNSGIFTDATIDWKDDLLYININICNLSEPREISKWKLVGDALDASQELPEADDSIYLPYRYRVVGGYELGDEFIMEINGLSYEFIVAGYFEVMYMDNMFIGEKVFIPDERFTELSKAIPEFRKVLVFANGIENHERIIADLFELTGLNSNLMAGLEAYLGGTDINAIKISRTSVSTMMSGMIIVVTAVILLICLLVIRFRVSNSIEEDMPKIGSLQSVGYTSRQIKLSVAMQYTVIALIASLMGIIPAFLLLPTVGDVFAQQNGLLWAPAFDIIINAFSVISLTFIVAIVALIAARKIGKINPVTALRGGITTHSFKKNHVPLEKTRLPLTLALAIKSVLQSRRQSITMFVTVHAVTFTAIIAMVLYYNAAVDLTAFEKVPGIERANAGIVFMPTVDSPFEQNKSMDELREETLTHKDVRKAQFLDMGNTRVDDIDVGVVVMNDFSGKETVNVYRGIFPRYDNEIAITGGLADLLGKNIGDEVTVGSADNNKSYIITGLAQGQESGATYTVYLTLDGMRKIQLDFKQLFLTVYLNPNVDTPTFVAEMEKLFVESGRANFVVDSDAGFAEGVSSFADIMSLVGLAILAVAGFVIVLVLYFVISSLIIRKRRDLGIQKAIGYTTVNLMNQINIAFTLPILFGATIGSFCGAVLVNPLMSVGMYPLVVKANFIVNPIWVIATGVVVIVLSYLTGLLITWRIRKISAFALVTE
jgi:putative ABC transport system permease protein